MEPETQQGRLVNENEVVRAVRLGLGWKYTSYESVAREILAALGHPDTPVNRAQLAMRAPGGAWVPMMAGDEMTYFRVFVRASPARPAGHYFIRERRAPNMRVLFIPVTPEEEAQLLAKARHDRA